ncbi:hypothetical protein N0V95_003068, partial [Ascochyta clinopodiicola]
MTSPHDEHHFTAAPPNNVTLTYSAAADTGAGAGPATTSTSSTSFNTLAATATLATLSDSRPPASFGEDEVSDDDQDDDDESGGISLAHLTAHFTAPPAPPALLSHALS